MAPGGSLASVQSPSEAQLAAQRQRVQAGIHGLLEVPLCQEQASLQRRELDHVFQGAHAARPGEEPGSAQAARAWRQSACLSPTAR